MRIPATVGSSTVYRQLFQTGLRQHGAELLGLYVVVQTVEQRSPHVLVLVVPKNGFDQRAVFDSSVSRDATTTGNKST